MTYMSLIPPALIFFPSSHFSTTDSISAASQSSRSRVNVFPSHPAPLSLFHSTLTSRFPNGGDRLGNQLNSVRFDSVCGLIP